jgi:hypothetical protein
LHGLLLAAQNDDPELPKRARAQIIAAADYLAVAPTVVRVARDAPVKSSRSDVIPSGPADPQRVAELAERWNLGQSVERLLKSLQARA